MSNTFQVTRVLEDPYIRPIEVDELDTARFSSDFSKQVGYHFEMSGVDNLRSGKEIRVGTDKLGRQYVYTLDKTANYTILKRIFVDIYNWFQKLVNEGWSGMDEPTQAKIASLMSDLLNSVVLDYGSVLNLQYDGLANRAAPTSDRLTRDLKKLDELKRNIDEKLSESPLEKAHITHLLESAKVHLTFFRYLYDNHDAISRSPDIELNNALGFFKEGYRLHVKELRAPSSMLQQASEEAPVQQDSYPEELLHPEPVQSVSSPVVEAAPAPTPVAVPSAPPVHTADHLAFLERNFGASRRSSSARENFSAPDLNHLFANSLNITVEDRSVSSTPPQSSPSNFAKGPTRKLDVPQLSEVLIDDQFREQFTNYFKPQTGLSKDAHVALVTDATKQVIGKVRNFLQRIQDLPSENDLPHASYKINGGEQPNRQEKDNLVLAAIDRLKMVKSVLEKQRFSNKVAEEVIKQINQDFDEIKSFVSKDLFEKHSIDSGIVLRAMTL